MSVKEEYQKAISEIDLKLAELKTALRRILFLRLSVFGLMVTVMWIGFDIHWSVPLSAFGVGMGLFLFLVKINEQLKLKKSTNEELKKLNQSELKGLTGDYSSFEGGGKYHEIEHAFAYDLDIFGKQSFFQSLNRSATNDGEELLASWVKTPGSSNIKLTQEAVQEITKKKRFRQQFYVIGKMYKTDKAEKEIFTTWFKDFNFMVLKSVFWKIYRFLMPAFALTVLGLHIVGVISFFDLLMGLMLPLAVTAFKLKHTNQVYNQATEVFTVIAKSGNLLELVEKEDFNSKLLSEIKEDLVKSGWTSKDIQKINQIINAFDSRLNPFVGILLNAFLAWDFQCLYKLEKWADQHKEKAGDMIKLLSRWDAYSSLGTYAYNHPKYVYPETGEDVLKVKNAGHPFISESECVTNDFSIDNLGEFKIITGANMAGKSTFLRTVGLSLVMAQSGLPVYAESYSFKPLKIYTSMRTTDSLQEHESYFYTELKRLKALVKKLDEGEQIFVILDEILKGTNSKDKAQGSQRFVEKLLGYPIAGIIATHDLSLTSLGDKSDKVSNICFEVEFGKDDLVFDYKLKPGVCQNMNATWLLEKMELV